jgi:hypothetical protein
MPPDILEPLLDTPEAAKVLRKSAQTLCNYRVMGIGPKFVKLGHHIAYRPSDLRDYIAANVRTSTSETEAE